MSRTYILYAVNELHLSAATIGIAFAIGNIGTLVGAVLANRLAGWVGVGPTIIGSMFIGSFVGVLVALAPPGDAAVPFIIAAGVIGGVSRMIYNIKVSFRQAICPPRMQGRMNATVRFLVWGTIPIRSILGGVLGPRSGSTARSGLPRSSSSSPRYFPCSRPSERSGRCRPRWLTMILAAAAPAA
ncbi:MAG: hypothetical protein ACAH65_09615 [Chloroflexota bacterium]